MIIGVLAVSFTSIAKAETPALLTEAINHWDAGQKDLAFTQHGALLGEKDQVEKTWVERYDPSLPDSQRWRLLEVNGKPATDAERKKWESKKNSKPRKKALKPLSEYLDLPNARKLDETDKVARFEVGLRPDAMRLAAVEKLALIMTIDKTQKDITHIAATLREPMKIALGLAKVTDVDFDVHVEPDSEKKDGQTVGDVKEGSTAKVVVSKFGDPMEYRWSDFKRVDAYGSKGTSAGSISTGARSADASSASVSSSASSEMAPTPPPTRAAK